MSVDELKAELGEIKTAIESIPLRMELRMRDYVDGKVDKHEKDKHEAHGEHSQVFHIEKPTEPQKTKGFMERITLPTVVKTAIFFGFLLGTFLAGLSMKG